MGTTSTNGKLARSRNSSYLLSPLRQMPWEAKELYYAPFCLVPGMSLTTLKRRSFLRSRIFTSRSLLEGSPPRQKGSVALLLPSPLLFPHTAHAGQSSDGQSRSGRSQRSAVIRRAFNAVSHLGCLSAIGDVQDVKWVAVGS
jgi:hypothetical protein